MKITRCQGPNQRKALYDDRRALLFWETVRGRRGDSAIFPVGMKGTYVALDSHVACSDVLAYWKSMLEEIPAKTATRTSLGRKFLA